MGFLSKQIGEVIMEKFKIYVHHKYSYERFWYFFHGVDVDINDVITHTNRKNMFNKFSPINENVNIKCKYNGVELDITFVGNDKHSLKGHHIIDYSIDLYDRNLVSDRGFNSRIRKIVDEEYIPLLNNVSKSKETKYHFFYIDWEGHNPYYEHNMDVGLTKDINIYVDEQNDVNIKHKHFVFTNIFMSFLYPNTLGLREYYFFADILKYKNDYTHKMNFPIRRIYGHKLRLYRKIIELKNSNINITHSSFHETPQYSGAPNKIRNKIKDKITEKNYIEKRGYGIDDWGGEWNDNNLSEFLWKLFGIAEVNIIPEYDFQESVQHGTYDIPMYKHGLSNITEKSVSHILANKPFIPTSYNTIVFYDSILTTNGYPLVDYPLKYESLEDIIDNINEIANDDIRWNELVVGLKKWVDNTRNGILHLIDNKNDFLEILLKANTTKKNKNLL